MHFREAFSRKAKIVRKKEYLAKTILSKTFKQCTMIKFLIVISYLHFYEDIVHTSRGIKAFLKKF